MEFQVFSKSLVPVMNEGSNRLIPKNKRRSNFNGQKVRFSLDRIDVFRDYNINHVKMLESVLNLSVEIIEFVHYGILDSNGSWSGMIGGLIRNEIDVCKVLAYFNDFH